MYFGTPDGTVVNQIPVTPSTQYTVVCWVKGIANYNAQNRLIIRSQSGVERAQQSFTATSGWLRVSAIFTTGP